MICFHFTTPSFPKTSINAGISSSPTKLDDYQWKNHKPDFLSIPPNCGRVQRIDRFPKHSEADKFPALVGKRGPNRNSILEDPSPDRPQTSWVGPSFEADGKGEVDINVGGRYVKIAKANTKRSKKCVSYGGCIPTILQALETTKDLDDAFRPWEETLSNKERTIILKEQSSWERALEIFEWFKSEGYELNVIHYNIMLRILGKEKKWSELERLLDEMGSKNITLVNSTYGTLIDVYSKGGMREKALVWLQIMNDKGLELDEVTMGIVLQMFKKAGEFEKAKQFFQTWSTGKSAKEEPGSRSSIVVKHSTQASHAQLSLSSYTYNTLIDTYGKAGQLQEVSKTFDQMLRDGCLPDTITFNTLLHIYGNHGCLEEVGSLVPKMEQLKCKPDTRTYNILISLYAKHDDINGAIYYFVKMKEACLEPDLVSYRTLLYALSIRSMVGEAETLVMEMDQRGLEIDEFTQSALTRMYIEAGMLERSWLWFERFHLQGNMSSDCYSANIDAYGERGHIKEAERAFACCRHQNKLGVIVFNVMVKTYGKGNKFKEACDLFNSMKNHGVIPDRCTYISLILMLAGADLPQLAKPYLLKMQEAGLVNDCIPYCAVISSFAKLGQLDLAVSLYEEMISHNLEPDIVVYGALINACTESGKISEAVNYVETMKRSGLSFNVVICKTLIKLYTKVGSLKEAEEVYELLRSSKDGTDVYTSNCMIDLYSKYSMIKEAEDIFDAMEKRGDANEFSFSMMMCLYKRMGRLEEAMIIARRMRDHRLVSELLSYNSLLSLFAMEGRSNEVLEIFNEMIEGAIEPDEYTFRSIGAFLLKSGVPKKTVEKLDVMRKQCCESGLRAWISALTSVVGEDDI